MKKNLKTLILIINFSLLIANSLYAQQQFQFTPVAFGDLAWGDYNNDGYEELLLTGETEEYISKIYKNNGDGTFTEQNGENGSQNAELTGVSSSSVDWGDYNNDGYLDILLTGHDENYNKISKIYRNNGDGTFTDIEAGLTGVSSGSVDWGDYNNDNYLDILLTGVESNTYTPTTKIYKNNGDETFTDIEAGLTGVSYSSVVWGDYNNDNYLDILLTGVDGETYTPTTIIYKNNGDETFTDINAELIGIFNGSVAWGDYNNDSYIDILLVEGSYNIFYGFSGIYKNNGNGTFTDINANLYSVQYNSIDWGDYNNDGYLDILLTGKDLDLGTISKIYKNNSDGTFTDIEAEINGIRNGSVAWCDYNNDNNLDFIISGDSNYGYTTELYTNNGNNNFETNKILNLSNEFYRYNTFIEISQFINYNNDNYPDIVGQPNYSKSCYLNNNINNTFSYIGNYNKPKYWADINGDGLTDGIRDSLTYINNGDSTFSTNLSNIDDNIVWIDLCEWGDFNNDGNIDMILEGQDENYNEINKIYKNNGDSTFSPINSDFLTDIDMEIVACADYNNDNYSDIFIYGNDGNYFYKIYKNNGNETFTDIEANLPIRSISSFDWGDYDNDDDLDILLIGTDDNYNNISKIYTNNGDDTFTEFNIGLPTLDYGEARWGDYNNDSYLDIVISGTDNNYNGISKIYKNIGGENFVDINANIRQFFYSILIWQDYNNDGNLDLFIRGRDINDNYGTFIYKNNGDETFEEIFFKKELTPVVNSSAEWADYNKDGYYDILYSGIKKEWTGDSTIVTTVNKCQKNQILETVISLTGLENGSVGWFDFNNDGYTDILITGKNQYGMPISKLYENGTNEVFVNTSINIVGVYEGNTDFADYNNDGLTDILICGKDDSDNFITKIYTNLGNNNFAESNIYIPGASKALWADFDNDNDFDIVFLNDNYNLVIYENINNNFEEVYFKDYLYNFELIDYNNDGKIDILTSDYYLNIYKNNSNFNFSWVGETEYSGIYDTRNNQYISIADYNNDGKSDIAINQIGKNGFITANLYEISGNTITETANFPGTINGDMAWADWDNDHDLDMFITGEKNYNLYDDYQTDTIFTELYLNSTETPNTPPTPPTNLQFTCSSDTVFISWQKATDEQTPQNGLTYNCYMYEIEGDTIWHSLSNQGIGAVNNGKRYLPKIGNVQHNTSWFIHGLDPTNNYAWSVQAVDNGFEGSNFAPEVSFRVAPAFIVQPKSKTVCELGSITFNSITTEGATYQWYEITENDTIPIGNNEFFSNATTEVLTISNAQLYMNAMVLCLQSSVNDTITHSYSNPVVLTVDSLFLANAGEDAGVCSTDEIQLSANEPKAGTGLWTSENEQVTFVNPNLYNTTAQNLPLGTTVLTWNITQNNVCGSNSDIVIISRFLTGAVPDKPTKPTGDTALCVGSTLNFETTGSSTGEEYFWEIFPQEAGTITGSDKIGEVVWNPFYYGNATLKVQSKNKCGYSDWSDSLKVNLKDFEASDIIEKSKTMLVAIDSGYSYQWYLNNELINGANKQYYYNENMPAGDYSIQIKFHQGCFKFSEILIIGISTKKTKLSETISIYPNPTTSKFTIEIINDYTGKINYQITNSVGQILLQTIINKQTNYLKIEKDLLYLPTGIYLIDFIFEKEKVTKQLIIK